MLRIQVLTTQMDLSIGEYLTDVLIHLSQVSLLNKSADHAKLYIIEAKGYTT